jgi:hypothetical protein
MIGLSVKRDNDKIAFVQPTVSATDWSLVRHGTGIRHAIFFLSGIDNRATTLLWPIADTCGLH